MATLNDQDVAAEIAQGRLIRNCDPDRLSCASYELRLGNVYYDLTESDRPIRLKPGDDVLIKPGHRVVLITHEELDIPDDVLARVISKGSLFSIGLSPVATYADPGFSGHLGIVTQNVSNKFVLLPQLEPIAKADFTRLTGPSARPYRGQHGYQTSIWPIKHHLQKTYAEVRRDPRVGTEKEEGYRLLPQATADILRTLERRRRLVDLAIMAAVILNSISLFLVGDKLIDNVQGLVGNLLASLIVALFVLYAERRR